jgi:hypothetical protein
MAVCASSAAWSLTRQKKQSDTRLLRFAIATGVTVPHCYSINEYPAIQKTAKRSIHFDLRIADIGLLRVAAPVILLFTAMLKANSEWIKLRGQKFLQTCIDPFLERPGGGKES